MKEMIQQIAEYYRSMHSERTGKVSIKRNIASVITTLIVFVEVWATVVLGHGSRDMAMYIGTVKFFIVANMMYSVLLLGIAKFGELQELVSTIKGNKVEPAKSE